MFYHYHTLMPDDTDHDPPRRPDGKSHSDSPSPQPSRAGPLIPHTIKPYSPSYSDFISNTTSGSPSPPHSRSPSPSDPPGSTWAKLGDMLAPIVWEWPGWLAPGFLTVLAGEPGAGKSLLSLHLAATYLDGRPWPDGTPFEAASGHVVWCESEASHALNLERAYRWGIDLEHILSPLNNPLYNFKLDNQKHFDALFHFARRHSVSLVILDSLRGLRSHGSYARPLHEVISDLADLARLSGKPVLLTHHLRKRTAADAARAPSIDRLLGASVITQAARVVWAIDSPDPAAPDHRRLSVIKNNLAPLPDPLGMTVHDGGLHFGPPPQPPRRLSQLDRAIAFLRDLLAAGPLPPDEIFTHGEAEGLSRPTLRRAKKHLGIRSLRPPGDTHWVWDLPGKK